MRNLVKVAAVVVLALIVIARLKFGVSWRDAVAPAGSSDAAKADGIGEAHKGAVENPTITLIAVGDVMMHIGQIWSGYDAKTKRFDYSEFFNEAKHVISSADLSMANLETTLAGQRVNLPGIPGSIAPMKLPTH
nr:CapA family protein [Thermosediminibacter oceani]